MVESLIARRTVGLIAALCCLLATRFSPLHGAASQAASPGTTVFLPLALNPRLTTIVFQTLVGYQPAQQPRLGPSTLVDVYLFSAGNGAPRRVLQNVVDTTRLELAPGGQFLATDDGIIDSRTGKRTSIPGFGENPQWRPDGQKIAFVRRVNTIAHLFTVNPDGSELQEIQVDGLPANGGQWSPDGTRIIASTAQGVFVVATSTGTANKVADRCDAGFAWSPDGVRLVCKTFTNSSDPQASTAWSVVRADGLGAAIELSTPSTAPGSSPLWSPTSDKIAYVGADAVWIVTIDGAVPRRSPSSLNIATLRWSPDGSNLAFTTNEYAYARNAIYSINADGSDERRVVAPDSRISNVIWSPNSAQILYVPFGEQRAYTVDRATGIRSLLSQTPITHLLGYADGGRTLYAVAANQDRSAFLALPIGGQPAELFTISAGANFRDAAL